MPFTVPTTYRSQANTGYGSVFSIGDSASPPAYTGVAELKQFDLDGISLDQLDITHLLSPNNSQELAPGLQKVGKVSCGGNFIGDNTQLNLQTMAANRVTFPFKATSPVQNLTKTLTVSGYGFISGLKVGPFEMNKAIEFSFDVQLTGQLTFAVA